MARGGKRDGAGRPSINKKSTKLTVYEETRASIMCFAEEFGLTGSELMEKLISDADAFRSFVKSVLDK